MVIAHTRCQVLCAVVQTSALSNPLPRKCTWSYDHQSSVIQTNLNNCFPDVLDQLTTFKAYDDLLHDKVYPYLVPFWSACASCAWMHASQCCVLRKQRPAATPGRTATVAPLTSMLSLITS